MSDGSRSEIAEKLRTKASQHPTVAELTDRLEQFGEDVEDTGLYISTSATPGITVNGEVRVSIARLYSVEDGDRQLVGQLQAVREVDHPLATWELNFYAHSPDNFHTNQIDDQGQWFVRVLDLHYKRVEEQVEIAPEIEA
jgi:hypothetical protein